MSSDQQTIDLAQYGVSQEVKEVLGKCFFSAYGDANYQSFKEYSYTLRYTKLYKGCVWSYGSQSDSFRKLNWNTPNSLSDYIKQIIPTFEKLAQNPYSFVYPQVFKCKPIENVEWKLKQNCKLLEINYGIKSQQEFEKQIDNIVFELLRENLTKCFSIYKIATVDQLREKYNKLVKKTSFPGFLKSNKSKFPQASDWEDIVAHGLNVNILQQIISDMKQTNNKLIQVFDLICKPIANEYCDSIGERMVWWAAEHPNLDQQGLAKLEAQNKQKNKSSSMDKKQKTYIQMRSEDQSFKRSVMYRLRDVEKYHEDNKQTRQYKYFNELVQKRKQKNQNTSPNIGKMSQSLNKN